MQKVVVSRNKPKSNSFKDIYREQLIELAEIRNPGLDGKRHIDIAKSLESEYSFVYVHYPWLDLSIKCVSDKGFNELKTNRNKYLITEQEQGILSKLRISVAGMSVGSSILYGLIGSLVGSDFYISDDDYFSTTNLNRVSATLPDVSNMKVESAYRRAVEMNPFINMNVLDQKLSDKNLDIFTFSRSVDIIFEEIDDLVMKIKLREYAKLHKKPLVMLTNMGDTVMIDIERHDTENTQVFNGLVDKKIIQRIKLGGHNSEELNQLVASLVDKELLTGRLAASLKDVGRKLAGRPQLYGTVAMDGGIASYIARRIFIYNDLPSGRYYLKLSSI